MTYWRSFPAILLALALALTSVTQAMARADMPGAGSIVICSGQGEITITLDGSGGPVPGQHHHCPDCTPALLLASASPPLVAPVVAGRGQHALPCQGHRISRPLPATDARAPPVPV